MRGGLLPAFQFLGEGPFERVQGRRHARMQEENYLRQNIANRNSPNDATKALLVGIISGAAELRVGQNPVERY